MEVFDAVRTMLAVRAYTDEPVPDEVIKKVLHAGRLTASSTNRQDWHFIVITDKDQLTALAELASHGPYMAGAAFAVAVLMGDYNSARADAGRAVQDMMLTAWAEGVGSNWVGRVSTDGIRQLLGVPAEYTVITIVPFGYPQQKIGAGKKDRKPLNEIASRGRFGVPLGL